MKLFAPPVLVSAALALSVAACTQTTAPAPGASVEMADSAGCKGAIASYRSVMSNDLSMGHVNQSVYTRVDKEIERAEATCTAGREGEAIRMINATKSRYGYR